MNFVTASRVQRWPAIDLHQLHASSVILHAQGSDCWETIRGSARKYEVSLLQHKARTADTPCAMKLLRPPPPFTDD